MSKLDQVIAQIAEKRIKDDVQRIVALGTRGRIYLGANSVWNKAQGNIDMQKLYITETAAIMPQLAAKKHGPARTFLGFVMRRAIQVPALHATYVDAFKKNLAATIQHDPELGFQMARSLMRVGYMDKNLPQNLINIIAPELEQLQADGRTKTISKYTNFMLGLAQKNVLLREKAIDAAFPHMAEIIACDRETGIHIAEQILHVAGRNYPLLQEIAVRAFKDEEIGNAFNTAAQRMRVPPVLFRQPKPGNQPDNNI